MNELERRLRTQSGVGRMRNIRWVQGRKPDDDWTSGRDLGPPADTNSPTARARRARARVRHRPVGEACRP